MWKPSSKDLHEQFELNMKREIAEAERNQKSAQLPKRLYYVCRFVEIVSVVFIIYQYLFGDGIGLGFMSALVVWLLLSPSTFFYKVWLEYLNNANLNYANAETMKIKNEMLYELDEIKKKIGI
ncbi:hypothetical protein GCM10007931_09390 [Vibrio algivorus]|uniref:2TM domain-containing protein n=2 Tax=Vibrio algivorus TaxID=1667024 RepID=A0ABQ6EMY8_9VIBR|nr:hypothetical protein GCM10007931_09390 [Vibrio algivorus]